MHLDLKIAALKPVCRSMLRCVHICEAKAVVGIENFTAVSNAFIREI